MAGESPVDAALQPLAPGELIRIGNDSLNVDVAPQAGGRIAQISCDGVDWLAGYSADNAAAIGWGCYPMVPWAGRIRHGRFSFKGREVQLPLNLGAHAIHGVGFVLPWQVTAQSAAHVDLALQLPEDERWPLGGAARQRILLSDRGLRLELFTTAGRHAMPHPVLGWHPWFVKPERLEFAPTHCYPRDAEGIATLPMKEPPWGSPWDDCFINAKPVLLHREQRTLRLTSDCFHWVVYDERAHATCVEPQLGPPDAFNLLTPPVLHPGETAHAWFQLEWPR